MHQLLFSILLILLPTQLGLHFWPEWTLVLGRRVDYLSPTLYLTDILVFLVIFFWALGKKFSLPPRQVSIKVFFLLVFVFANIYFAANRFVSLYIWGKVLEYGLLGLYIYKTKPESAKILFFLSIGILYSSLIALGQFLFQHTLGLWILGERTFTMDTPGIARVDFWGMYKMRAYATFPHPNVLGGFLAVLLPAALAQKGHRIFYRITGILGVAALAVTFSRSAWAVAAVGTALVTFRKKLFIPVVAAGAALLVIVSQTIGLQDETVVVREGLNSAAVSMFTQSPLIGKGLGNFLVTLPDHLVSRQIYFLQPVHNIYLLLLAETGVIGFLLFLLLLFRVFGGELRIMNYELWKKPKKKITILHYSLFIILILGFVDHYFLTLQQGQLLLTILLSSTIAL